VRRRRNDHALTRTNLKEITMTDPTAQQTIDPRHLVVIGAGPGVGAAVARRFGREGFRITLLSRGAAALDAVATDVRSTGARVDPIVADPARPEQLRTTLATLYSNGDAPGVLVYNASILAPDSLLTTDVEHLHEAYNVDVVSAIVATQVAAPVMQAAGGGTILFTGGGFAEGRAAVRCHDAVSRPRRAEHPAGQRHDRRPGQGRHRVRRRPNRRHILEHRFRTRRRLEERVPLRRLTPPRADPIRKPVGPRRSAAPELPARRPRSTSRD
jgi:hypothetical protein